MTNAANQKGMVALKTTINKSGKLSLAGNLQIYPLEAALDIETRAISWFHWSLTWDSFSMSR